MDNVVTTRPYEATDGIEMLRRMPGGLKGYPDADKWCKEAEQEGMAFTVIYNGEMICCAGVAKEREGVGLAWALYPLDIGKCHIDPRMARDKLDEIMAKYGLWRVAATVRVDFPAGASYLRWLGFKREGRMIMNEPDKTDSFLYGITICAMT